MNVGDDIEFERLAAKTEGASGADIKAICTEAGMVAIRDDRSLVRTADFERAHEKLSAVDESDEVSKTFA